MCLYLSSILWPCWAHLLVLRIFCFFVLCFGLFWYIPWDILHKQSRHFPMGQFYFFPSDLYVCLLFPYYTDFNFPVMLNRSSESGNPYPVPQCEQETLYSYFFFSESFHHKWVLNFFKHFFCHQFIWSCDLLLQPTYMMDYSDWFFNAEPALHTGYKPCLVMVCSYFYILLNSMC